MMNRIHGLPALQASLLMVATLTGCDTTFSPEQKREKTIAAIGTDASVTAAMFVSAARSCQVVGVNDIERCVQLKSSLIADQAAQIIASVAVDKTKEYWKKCQADFSQDYCNQLIQRAVAIEYRKPRTSE